MSTRYEIPNFTQGNSEKAINMINILDHLNTTFYVCSYDKREYKMN